MLFKVIRNIDCPITFWLDGHYSGGNTGKRIKRSPILEELKQIAQHPIKRHTIIIDDVRCIGSVDFDGTTLEMVKQHIYAINPKYRIKFYRGTVKDDILVAYIPK